MLWVGQRLRQRPWRFNPSRPYQFQHTQKEGIMKKLFMLLTLVIAASNSFANSDPYITATETFDAGKKITATSTITWITVDDVPKACKKKSEELGLDPKGFKNPRACSFYTSSTCTIITKKNPIIGSLEHEVRHCFQGNWH